MARRRKKARKAARWLGAFLVGALVVLFLAHETRRFGHHRIGRGVPHYAYRPELSTLAPGASSAIRRALGPRGLDRVTQIISPGDRPSLVSGGTHMPSGEFHGRPYGLAFDIGVDDPAKAVSDTRALRLQGIAAWYRAPGSADGVAGDGPHIHCVWPGATTSNPQNLQQIASFAHGYRALADSGKPHRAWIDPSIRKDEIARVAHIYRLAHPGTPLDQITPYDALHRGRETVARARDRRGPSSL